MSLPNGDHSFFFFFFPTRPHSGISFFSFPPVPIDFPPPCELLEIFPMRVLFCPTNITAPRVPLIPPTSPYEGSEYHINFYPLLRWSTGPFVLSSFLHPYSETHRVFLFLASTIQQISFFCTRLTDSSGFDEHPLLFVRD